MFRSTLVNMMYFETYFEKSTEKLGECFFFYILVSTCALELVSNADNFPKHEVGMATMSSHNLSSLYGLV